MKKHDTPKRVRLAYVPEDSTYVSAVAEGLKRQGVEVVGRTVQKRRPTQDDSQVRELQRLTSCYLRKLKEDPRPMRVDPCVYISYAREDYDHVRRFQHELLRMGLDAFLDVDTISGIIPGTNWLERIAEELSRCSIMVFFISPHSLQSHIVGCEVRFFLERMKIRGGTFLAFVLLDKMDLDLGDRHHGFSIIEFYRLPAKDAARQLIRDIVEFSEKEQELVPGIANIKLSDLKYP